ncbi:hypothetical protein [uncultured Sphingomonas sp.]|uniref:hypothetical protein n=1 Tax=uncultured Sphingomonas sp. TaxID=158754 RepID=UPI0035CBA8E3
MTNTMMTVSDTKATDNGGLIWKKISYGLGVFSLVLGAAELLVPKRIAKALSSEGHEKLIRGFGARELVAGGGLVTDPGHGLRVWNRVAGDAMDLTALHFARVRAPGNRTIWGAIAAVAAVTTLDICTAVGLDRRTGKSLPIGR